MDPVFSATLQLALALLFAGAALHKARDLAGFRVAIEQYEILPPRTALLAATGLIAAEAAISLSLLVPSTAELGAIGAASVLLVYSAAIAVNLSRGRSGMDCGCGGAVGPRRIGTGLLWRNGVLLVGCALAAVPAATRPLLLYDRITICFAVATASLAYCAAELLSETARSPFRRRISR
jgi:hypothetical protein